MSEVVNNRSPQYDNANKVVTTIARRNTFDTFIHFKKLNDFQRESSIPLEYWSRLLDEWDYEPGAFLSDNGRGNCVDFARGTQDVLYQTGIDSTVIGKAPDDDFSYEQKKIMLYRHTSLISTLDEVPTLFEPGWKLHQGIPLIPSGTEIDTGTWKFNTIRLTNNSLVQQTTSPLGKIGVREYSLCNIDKEQATAITKGLLRVPRRMEILTRLDDTIPHGIISFNPHANEFRSTLKILGDNPFIPSDITLKNNEKISSYYGFDVKEELLGCFALYKSLPESFWVK